MLQFNRKFKVDNFLKSESLGKVTRFNKMSDNSLISCNKHMDVINQVKKQVTTVKIDSDYSAVVKNALEVTAALGWVFLIVWGEVCCLVLFGFIFVSRM